MFKGRTCASFCIRHTFLTYNTDMSQKRKCIIYAIVGFFVVNVLGSLFHFVYEWTGNARWAAFFFAVNESVWEHLKLIVLPMSLFALLAAIPMRGVPNRPAALGWGMTAACLFVVIGFYTYTAIVGRSVIAVDISLFTLSIALGFWVQYLVMTHFAHAWFVWTGRILAVAWWIMFALFTFFPPQCALFRDPISGGYGIVQG